MGYELQMKVSMGLLEMIARSSPSLLTQWSFLFEGGDEKKGPMGHDCCLLERNRSEEEELSIKKWLCVPSSHCSKMGQPIFGTFLRGYCQLAGELRCQLRSVQPQENVRLFSCCLIYASTKHD